MGHACSGYEMRAWSILQIVNYSIQLKQQQKPYCVSGVKGTSFQVIAARVHKLVTYSGATDKGELSIDDINSMFLKTEGYKQEQPVVTAEPSSYEPAYEVDF